MKRNKLKAFIVTKEFIEQGISAHGGWTRRQLDILRVQWPPARDWMKRCVNRKISAVDAAEFLALNGIVPEDNKKKSRPHKRHGSKIERRRRTDLALKNTAYYVMDSRKHGLDIEYNHDERGRTLHVMFNHYGNRVINWWPATGTVLTYDNQRDEAHDYEDALRIAVDVLSNHPSAHLHETAGV